MEIIVDTREQKPLSFDFPVSREALPVGDYRGRWADGTLSRTVFERKSIIDLYGSLSKGYARFQKTFAKAAEKNIKLVIIIEGTLRKVLKGHKRSHRDPLSLIQQLFTIRQRHGVGHVYCADRQEAADYIAFALLAEQRRHLETRKNRLYIKRKKS